MADSDMLHNLAAAAVQMTCLAVVAEVLWRAIPVTAAGFQYAYWRLVLAAAFVLPWLLRATPPGDVPALAGLTSLPDVEFMPMTGAAAAVAPGGTNALAWLPSLLAAGAALRLLWVAVGLVRLRAASRQGSAVIDPEYQEIQERLGTRADIRAVAGLGQPVTFGVWRPVVLLPQTLAHADLAIRRAVVAHELIHVQRRDWSLLLVEELLRAFLWFHPAIWWLTARVRLAREEFTDHVAVLATGNRRSYIAALLAFADAPHLAPAPAFIRRAHLFTRIVLLTKESGMSSRRIAVSTIALSLLLGAGGWYASEAFPVRAARPLSTSANAAPASQAPGPPAAVQPITPENPIPRRLFAMPIPYPLELAGTGFESALSIRIVVDENGAIQSAFAGARAVASPGRQPLIAESEAMERFAAAAVEAIARWQYEPPARAPIAFYLAVVFKPGAPAVVSQSERPQAVRAGPEGARMLTPQEQTEFAARALAAQADRLRAPARGGGPFAPTPAASSRETARVPGLQETAAAGASAASGAAPRAAAAQNPPGSSTPGVTAPRETTLTVRPGAAPVRVGGDVRAPVQVRRVSPVYPEDARAARVQGVVILEAIIGDHGRVNEVRVLRSIPLLDQAAIDAVRQWEYAPTMLNGLPVPIVMTVTVQFTLD